MEIIPHLSLFVITISLMLLKHKEIVGYSQFIFLASYFFTYLGISILVKNEYLTLTLHIVCISLFITLFVIEKKKAIFLKINYITKFLILLTSSLFLLVTMLITNYKNESRDLVGSKSVDFIVKDVLGDNRYVVMNSNNKEYDIIESNEKFGIGDVIQKKSVEFNYKYLFNIENLTTLIYIGLIVLIGYTYIKRDGQECVYSIRNTYQMLDYLMIPNKFNHYFFHIINPTINLNSVDHLATTTKKINLTFDDSEIASVVMANSSDVTRYELWIKKMDKLIPIYNINYSFDIYHRNGALNVIFRYTKDVDKVRRIIEILAPVDLDICKMSDAEFRELIDPLV